MDCTYWTLLSWSWAEDNAFDRNDLKTLSSKEVHRGSPQKKLTEETEERLSANCQLLIERGYHGY
ncbi:hypothetical protein LF1_22730 [Rubripirellula obstinata]|uniref:Uncharacterized protein n=1 Tax=Rubripirellula obstinata TaxID=406547 RepID=A0A5B1CGQ1_9BACT|nr:hypothetical protein LF1_22730 [Rubripirellula obstinata]